MYQSFEQRMSDIYNAGAFERRRITRLIIESLEVAFHLCNTYTDEYSLTKIFDIVNCIMPTAYILNTGYWVFYSTQSGQGVCICVRFGLNCPHLRNDNHWINMESEQETKVTPFSSTQLGKYWPIDFNIHVTPMINDALRSYDVLIKMTVQSCYAQDVAGVVTNPTGFIICTEIRYLMTPEYYPHESKIVQFTPHPLTHRNYGKYCMALHTYFDTFGSQSQFFYKNTIITSVHPKLTVIPYGGTFLPTQNNSYNPRNTFNLSVLNEVNIAIYNENNYENGDYEITNVSHSTYTQDNNVVSYYPNMRSFDRFVDIPHDYVISYNNKPEEFSLVENHHKQKKRRGKYSRAPVGTRVSKEKGEHSLSILSENLSTISHEKITKLNKIYSPPGFFTNSFSHTTFELRKNQGVKRKEKKLIKCKSVTNGDSFFLPDIIIENSQDANEYLEDISDIIKNEMANDVEETIKLEQSYKNVKDNLFDLTKSPTPTRFLISSDEDD